MAPPTREARRAWPEVVSAVARYAAAVAICATAAGAEPWPLGRATLEARSHVIMPPAWRQGPEDTAGPPSAADLAAWPEASTRQLGDGWSGVGWFALAVDVAPELAGVPLAMALDQHGAAEIYLDGKLWRRVGTVGPDAATTHRRQEERPAVLRFARPGVHVLAVRYANHRREAFQRVGRSGGFFVRLGLADAMVEWYGAEQRWRALVLAGFLGVFLSVALLHTLMFVFHRRIRANLDFALLCLASAGLVGLLLGQSWFRDPATLLVSEPAMNVLGIVWGAVALRFVYRIFRDRPPRLYRFVFLPLAALLAVAAAVSPAATLAPVFVLMLVASVEMVRAVAVAWLAGRPGARTVGVGVILLALCFGSGLLANLGLLPSNRTTGILLPFLGVVALVASMSVYLSSAFGRAHADLRAQLVRVEELSAERLAQERRQRTEAVERGRLEAAYARKAEELEEARQLQLSMLPESVPTVPGFEIAAFMQTATEVGGDYYDFARGEDGALIVAIGDATGHGMRAGTMVTATKSLFQILGAERDLRAVLRRAAAALAGLRFERLVMALTLARFEAGGGGLRLAAAGMPPVLVHRPAAGTIEAIEVAGLPLGSPLAFAYEERSAPLAAGDTVLLASDGFAERCNTAGDPLGYERATALFADAAAAAGSAAAVIARLRAAADAWAGGMAVEDDVTYVVVRVGPAPAAHDE